jgi:hypothetical protein
MAGNVIQPKRILRIFLEGDCESVYILPPLNPPTFVLPHKGGGKRDGSPPPQGERKYDVSHVRRESVRLIYGLQNSMVFNGQG